ncbi:MAG: hypothetical protein NTY86_14400 [Deltaproteobacteria bacterium]|nr:hypothetical protein [Deltaproteobacteria bacterium]
MNFKVDISTYILTVVTLIIGWFLNILAMRFASKRTQELEKKKLLQTKIEELANLVYEVEKSYRKLWGEIAVNHFSSKQPLNMDGINLPFDKIQILINFYFPQLKPAYNDLVKEKDSFGEKIFPTLREGDEKKRSELFKDITRTHGRLEKACENICSLSSGISQEIM